MDDGNRPWWNGESWVSASKDEKLQPTLPCLYTPSTAILLTGKFLPLVGLQVPAEMAAGQTGRDSDISKAGRNVHADLIEGAGQPPIELYSLAPAWLFRNIELRKNAGRGALNG
jgi:hypothetical protein